MQLSLELIELVSKWPFSGTIRVCVASKLGGGWIGGSRPPPRKFSPMSIRKNDMSGVLGAFLAFAHFATLLLKKTQVVFPANTVPQ